MRFKGYNRADIKIHCDHILLVIDAMPYNISHLCIVAMSKMYFKNSVGVMAPVPLVPIPMICRLLELTSQMNSYQIEELRMQTKQLRG